MGFGIGGYGGYGGYSGYGYGPGFYGGYGTAAGYGAGGYGGYGAWGLKWFFALLILIVIVLQFGRNRQCLGENTAAAYVDGNTGCGEYGTTTNVCRNNDAIDNSVLFIIIVFLLVLCGGCWGGFGGGYGW